MEWVKERDLLIAQTLAFVQSVNARKADIKRSDTKLDLKSRIAAAPIDVIKIVEPPDSIPAPLTQAPWTQAPWTQAPWTQAPRTQAPQAQAPRTVVSGDLRTEMQARVANFRAHQERFSREREEYFSATLAKARAGIGEDSAPAPLRK
jgi:hypothetical protein